MKRKLAEMAVRVFRRRGDGLARARRHRPRAGVVDPADSPHVLKTIEQFAVECSINKVWTSEALAYAVDEAVQVYGGNGYSQEFPVERAYRDARITRIYEGTNEINRLIIGTRLLKTALAAATPVEGPSHPGTLGAEHDLLGRARRLAFAVLTTLSEVYGGQARDEQEILAHLADIVIEVYAIESALARAEKLQRGDSVRAGLAADAVRVYACDAADRMVHDARQVLNAAAARSDRSETLASACEAVAAHTGTDTIALRRRIGDAAIQASRYPF